MVSSHGDFSMLMLFFWVTLVSGAARQYGNLFPGSSRKLGTNLCRLSSFQGKGIRRAISSSSKNNGGVAEISESELAKRFYAWPDYKVSILDGSYKAILLVYSENIELELVQLLLFLHYFIEDMNLLNNMRSCNSVLFRNFVLSSIWLSQH